MLVWFVAKPRPATRDVELDDEEVHNPGESRVENPRPLPPLAEIAFTAGGPAVSFYALGDTGLGNAVLAANAASMERAAEARPVGFVLLLGDNFYPRGVTKLADPKWQSCFEEPFSGPNLQVPFRVVFGNHDLEGEPDVQIEYGKEHPRWKMPAHWYTFTEAMQGCGEVQFFALDTQPMKSGFSEARDEEAWLAAELAHSKARWKIVFGHHPVLSHGHHGPTAGVADSLVPLFDRYGVDLYASGHDHDLQLLQSRTGWLQLVSGGGSSTRDTAWGDDSLFAAASPGSAWIGIARTEMWIEMATAAEGPRFRWHVQKN